MESPYPAPLQAIVSLFAGLPEQERRELLIDFARRCANHAPQPGESFDLDDERRDEECTDTVGVHLRLDDDGCCRFRVSLGPEVQTLTRALSSVLCEGLSGASAAAVLNLPEQVVEEIAGARLILLRSRTAFYILHRMKEAVRKCLARPAG